MPVVSVRDPDGIVDDSPAEPIALDGAVVSAGRGLENAIVLGGPRVSRVHCAFHRLPDGGFKLVDAGSRNGTLVNGQLVLQKVLLPGDRIDIGGHVFTYAPPEPASRPAETAAPRDPEAVRPPLDFRIAAPIRPSRRPPPTRRRGAIAPLALACAAILLVGIFIGLAVSSGGGAKPASVPSGETAGGPASDAAAGAVPLAPPEALGPNPAGPSVEPRVVREPAPQEKVRVPSPASPDVESGTAPVPSSPVAKDVAPAEGPRRPRLSLATAKDATASARDLIRDFRFDEARDAIDALDGPNDGVPVDDEIESARAECDARRVAHDRLVAKLAEPGARKLPALPGRGPVRGATAAGVLAGSSEVPWRDVPPDTYAALLRATDPSAESLLGLAYHEFARRAEDEAHRAIERAVELEPGLQGEAWRLLARVLETPVPADGFVVHDHRFTTPERRDALVREARAKTLFAAAMGDDPSGARSAVAEIAKLGSAHQERLDALLADRLRVAEDGVRKDGGAKRLLDLVEERRVLDEARSGAFELILDTTKYPFPYEGDGVARATRTLHDKTQVEIDRRVSTVKKLSEDAESNAITIPSDLRKRSAALAAAVDLFAAAGRIEPKLGADVACAAFLPDGEKKVSALTICVSAAEKSALDRDARTMRENETKASSASAAERAQLRVTNDYRLMMGRRALALDERLLLSARDHCQEMYKCGYFGHSGATPETRSLPLRVRARGFTTDMVGENIARATSPQHAHSLWLHSSGHHRNILNEMWTVAGSAVAGDLFTQNFGAAEP